MTWENTQLSDDPDPGYKPLPKVGESGSFSCSNPWRQLIAEWAAECDARKDCDAFKGRGLRCPECPRHYADEIQAVLDQNGKDNQRER